MKRNVTFLTSLLLATICGVGIATALSANNVVLSFMLESEKTNKKALAIDASLFTGASGSFVLDGNSISYSDVSVSNSIITINEGGYIKLDNDSGYQAGASYTGSGVTTFDINLTSAYEGNIKINNKQRRMILSSGENEVAINSSAFNFKVVSGSLSASGFTINYECGNNAITYDGLAHESIWTSEVLSKPYHHKNTDDYKTEIYMSKQSDGIHIYAEQHVKTIKNGGSEWWEQDNMELRFASANKSFTSFKDETQYYFSVTGAHNFTNFGKTSFSLNSDTNLYDISYEAFLSWSALGYSYSDTIIFTCGANYNNGFAGDKGWESASSEIYKLKFMSIKATGIEVPFAGTEVTESPLFYPGNGWSPEAYTHEMDGSNNWTLYFKLHSLSNGGIATGFAGKITKKDDTTDFWDFRKDWCGGGTWSDTSYASDYSQFSTFENAEIALNDIDVDLVYRHEVSVGRVYVSAIYHSNVAGYEGKCATINYEASTGGYTNIIIAGVGYNNGKITVNSCQEVSDYAQS